MADTGRLDDAAVEARLARLDDMLAQLERIPGRTAELALDVADTLIEVYGEAVARLCGHTGDGLDGLCRDELLRHLLLLHHLHPEPTEARVAGALDDLRAGGVQVRQADFRDDTVHIGVLSGSCGSTTQVLRERVREAVLAAAPELGEVEVEAVQAAPTVIPVAALSHRLPRAPDPAPSGNAR
jgi:hypothetical protein